ncbi:MAG TPA: tRNA epoxyqueuosine(34) reductase QueG [Acidimicrobiales bacterium]|nr:tRNA epoxyqueuosine(34) reductase QueG [Acidimicrobiales bacterium]
MSPPTAVRARRVPDAAELADLGRASGLDAVGVTVAEPFTSTRRHLERRKAQGLHGGMAFTYRQPARSSDPSRALPDARALVVGARSYLRTAPPAPGTDDGRAVGAVARYAWTDYYGELRAALTVVAQRLRDEGWRTRVLADDNALVDREAARRAGLGWYGKNANLLLPGQGSWFVLGSIVTDAPLVPAGAGGSDPVPDGCGSCTRCLDGCPTGAIVEPGVVDARRCLAWLLQMEGPFPREHRAALGDRIYGCDDCQEVCPPNRRTARHSLPEAGGEVEAEVDLLGMLGTTDEELLARHGRWYVARRQARYLRRNALVVLGNVGDPGRPEVVEAVRTALADDDPLVRGHAVWAARRMGRADLVMPDDDDPFVREELAAPVEVRS